MSKSLGNSLLVPERAGAGARRSSCATTWWRRTTARHVEFSFEALDEAAAGFRRIERFLERAPRSGDVRPSTLPDAFVDAMDDDLGTPAAVAVIHDTVREGNKLLADGDHGRAARQRRARCARCSVCSGSTRLDPHWRHRRRRTTCTTVVDALVRGLLEQRAQARADKDFAAADAIRDRIKAAGIEVEDTPDGPRWTWSVADVRREQPAASQGRDPQGRARATRPPGRVGGSSAGSRARAPRRRRRTGRTTRPTSNEEGGAGHRVAAQAARRRRGATPSGSPGATASSRRCGPSCRHRGVRRRGDRA